MNEILTKFNPGRRLDAMVAMALGWRWYYTTDHEDPGRWLMPEPYGNYILAPNPLLPRGCTGGLEDVVYYSICPGIAFEAALEAGVLDERSVGKFLYNGEWEYEIEALAGPALATSTISLAHCLCLGILAIQPEDKLAEWESWLPEEVE